MVLCEPGKVARVAEIGTELSDLQRVVGGLSENTIIPVQAAHISAKPESIKMDAPVDKKLLERAKIPSAWVFEWSMKPWNTIRKSFVI